MVGPRVRFAGRRPGISPRPADRYAGRHPGVPPCEVARRHSANSAMLAVALELGADGERFGRDAQLTEATAEFEHLRNELHENWDDDELLWALFRIGDDARVLSLAPRVSANLRRNAEWVAALAHISGLDEALEQVRRFNFADDERRKVLEAASEELTARGDFSAAAALYARAVIGRGGEVVRRHLTRLERLRDCAVRRPAIDDPRSVVRAVLDPTQPPASVDAVLSTSLGESARAQLRERHLSRAGGLRIRDGPERHRCRHALVLHRGRGHQGWRGLLGSPRNEPLDRRADTLARGPRGRRAQAQGRGRRLDARDLPRKPSVASGRPRPVRAVPRRSSCSARLRHARGHGPAAARSLRRPVGSARRRLEGASASHGDCPAAECGEPDARGVARSRPSLGAARPDGGRPRRAGQGARRRGHRRAGGELLPHPRPVGPEPRA